MRLLIIIISLSFSHLCLAQNATIDSLIALSNKNINEDTSGIVNLFNLQKALNILQDNHSLYRHEEICLGLGDFFKSNEIHDNAINYYQTGLSNLSTRIIKNSVKINFIERIGECYIAMNLPDSAHHYYKQVFNVISFDKKLSLLDKLADSYSKAKSNQKSLDIYFQMVDLIINSNNENISLSKVYNNIGVIYNRLEQYNNSIAFFTRSLGYLEEENNEERSKLIRNIALGHYNLGEISKAVQLLQSSLKLSSDPKGQSEIEYLLAKIYLHNEDYFNAIEILESSHSKAIKTNDVKLLSDIYSAFSQLYQLTHEYDLAYKYFGNYSRLHDSLIFSEQLKRNQLLNNQKFIERTEKENSLLRAQQEFQRLQLDKLETEFFNQTLRNDALRKDSIQRINELELSRQQIEIAKGKKTNDSLELIRQNNLLKLKNQQLAISAANEQNARIEIEKKQKENELAKEKLLTQERDRLIELQKEGIRRSKVNQRNTTIIATLIGLIAILILWLLLTKLKDNKKLRTAYNNLGSAQEKLKSAEQKIKNLLSQQVSGAVAEALIVNNDPNSIDQKFVAVMFLDIRDFTVYAEGKKASVIIDFQNDVFGFMIDIIEKHHGIVNQLLGDGFMATFGAPTSKGNDCLNAYLAAKEIIGSLNKRISDKLNIPIKVGIGIHAGNVVTGNVGNKQRKQYSITGNTVILAARLEQLNKEYNSTIVLSKEFIKELPENTLNQTQFKSAMVKGRKKEISIAAFDENLFPL